MWDVLASKANNSLFGQLQALPSTDVTGSSGIVCFGHDILLYVFTAEWMCDNIDKTVANKPLIGAIGEIREKYSEWICSAWEMVSPER